MCSRGCAKFGGAVPLAAAFHLWICNVSNSLPGQSQHMQDLSAMHGKQPSSCSINMLVVHTQWPSLLRPLTQLSELPAPVLERYNAVQTVAFCGVFPEIRRAWASIDNELFLWRLDRWWARECSASGTTAQLQTQQLLTSSRMRIACTVNLVPMCDMVPQHHVAGTMCR